MGRKQRDRNVPLHIFLQHTPSVSPYGDSPPLHRGAVADRAGLPAGWRLRGYHHKKGHRHNLRPDRIPVGGGGGPAGPLTIIVSRGSAARAGRIRLSEYIPYTKERPSERFTELTVTECKTSGKWHLPLSRNAHLSDACSSAQALSTAF